MSSVTPGPEAAAGAPTAANAAAPTTAPTAADSDTSAPSRSAAREFGAGLVTVTPMLLGAVPFGLIYGALAIKAGISPLLAIAISSIVFAGSAQFMITKLVAASTPGALIVLSVGVINLRHALYSASLADKLAHLPARWKVLLAYLLTDEAYAAAIHRMESGAGRERRHWFLFGCGFGLWFTWQLACIAGVLLGGRIPDSWSLDFAGTLTFIAIVVPLLKDRASNGAMIVAGAVAVIAIALPHKLFVIVAALAGMGAGVLIERAGAARGGMKGGAA